MTCPLPFSFSAYHYPSRVIEFLNQYECTVNFIFHTDLHTHIDDEYARAGVDDPKILLTTSRDPSSRLLQFVKEMKSVFPNSQRINRGAAVIKELIEASRANDVTDLVIVHEHRGEPDGMIISHLPYGPTAYFGLRFDRFQRYCTLAHMHLPTKLTINFDFSHYFAREISPAQQCGDAPRHQGRS